MGPWFPANIAADAAFKYLPISAENYPASPLCLMELDQSDSTNKEWLVNFVLSFLARSKCLKIADTGSVLSSQPPSSFPNDATVKFIGSNSASFK